MSHKKRLDANQTRLIAEWLDTKKYFAHNQKIIPPSIKYRTDEFNVEDIQTDNVPHIEILNSDTFNLAIDYVNMGFNPLVLNMASAFKPGGGVSNGKTAQEEELFRRSNSHLTHPIEWYPLGTNEVIYSPQVTICKDSRDKRYAFINETTISMIASAAIKCPKLINKKYTPDDYAITLAKIESIFKIGILHGNDSLVLGALGCGVYFNPPEEVANIFLLMTKIYGKYFKRIGFAIMVVKNSDNENLDTFKRVFGME